VQNILLRARILLTAVFNVNELETGWQSLPLGYTNARTTNRSRW